MLKLVGIPGREGCGGYGKRPPTHRAMVLGRYASLLNHTAAWDEHSHWLERRARRHRDRNSTTPVHHRAYVGSTDRFGDMTASMFTLLYLSGMREASTVLDVGCGSLRLGRLVRARVEPQKRGLWE